MIKHIVMWKLKDFAEGKNKEENALIIKKSLEELPKKIKEIQSLEVGINIVEGNGAKDVVLVSEFRSLEDLEAYQIDKSHVEAASYIKKVVLDRVVCDYIHK